ncbi:MAG: antirestriction protein ArdA [Sulfurovum sp.]|nr:antirestriction protein ArdA [Sulfurovum sp.]
MLKIFLTDLAAYNAGCLSGTWIQLPLTKFELSQAISEVLSEGEQVTGEENHEEYFITDYEWDDIDIKEIDEYENIYELNDELNLLSDLPKNKLKAVKFLLDEGITIDIEDAISRAEDVTVYHNYTMEDVAYDLIDSCYNLKDIPDLIANNIDYDGIARDLEHDGTYWEIDGDVYEYIG